MSSCTESWNTTSGRSTSTPVTPLNMPDPSSMRSTSTMSAIPTSNSSAFRARVLMERA